MRSENSYGCQMLRVCEVGGVEVVMVLMLHSRLSRLTQHPPPGITTARSFLLQLTYLPPPWGECRSSEMGLDFFPVYSNTACRIDCETRYIVENCNCRMVHMPGWCRGPPGTHFLTMMGKMSPILQELKEMLLCHLVPEYLHCR